MKKLLFAMTLLLPATVWAEGAGISVGIDYAVSHNTFKLESDHLNTETDDNSSSVGLNLGILQGQAGKWFFSYQHESFDKPIYDATSDTLNYFSLGYQRNFFVNNPLSPYIKGSLGYGNIDVNGYDRSSATITGFRIGGGISYPMRPDLFLLVGIDYQYRSWDSLYLGRGNVLDISDTAFIGNVGIEYHF
ncbi:outer membrane beta-barrel protein [Vibrio rhizosphaerae]|uniref:Outer membrane beta-barrel protein n=1 Tax=Vibrio rhizosphaerae TaxID=398736 RepID=A0ABU4ISF5_9VIBR|nr:outer membrane beta-barrel protein [Vibrio rhizosphaerae]MDW6092357.1 outer membrane beta-barrel protein [Vibrio rhizosphaerae]